MSLSVYYIKILFGLMDDKGDGIIKIFALRITNTYKPNLFKFFLKLQDNLSVCQLKINLMKSFFRTHTIRLLKGIHLRKIACERINKYIGDVKYLSYLNNVCSVVYENLSLQYLSLYQIP